MSNQSFQQSDPLQSRVFDRPRTFVWTVSQISLQLADSSAFDEAIKSVLKWAAPKIGRKLSEEAWQGKTFETEEVGAQRTSAVRLEEPKYWAFRFDDADKTLPARTWTTEVSVADQGDGNVLFGCRLLCTDRGQGAEIDHSIPSFVRAIVFKLKATLDGREIGTSPWVVSSQDDVDELVHLLLSPSRRHEVVVISLPEDSDNPDAAVVPVTYFFRRIAGAAHCVIITGPAAYLLTDSIGSDFSTYRGAIRTYRPGFSPDFDLRSDHPLATKERILSWNDSSPQAFRDFLINQTLRVRMPREEQEKKHPPFHVVKRVASQLARQDAKDSGGTADELLLLAEEEIRILEMDIQAQSSEFDGLLAMSEEERENALARARESKARNAMLRSRIESLEAKLRIDQADQSSYVPSSLNEIEEWARDSLAGYIEIHQRAVKELRESTFDDPGFVCQVLVAMKEHYVSMRRQGGAEYVARFDTAMAELGLEHTKCFSQKNKANNFGGSYFVKYDGGKRELDWHLRGNNSRDGRRGFRLYFFWDNELQQVVVGSMPGHLPTDIT